MGPGLRFPERRLLRPAGHCHEKGQRHRRYPVPGLPAPGSIARRRRRHLVHATAPVSLDTTHITCMVCLGIVNTGLGYYLYFSGVQRLSAQSVSICGYMEPFTALALSAIILGESLTLLQWIGAACILGGVALSELWHPGKKR